MSAKMKQLSREKHYFSSEFVSEHNRRDSSFIEEGKQGKCHMILLILSHFSEMLRIPVSQESLFSWVNEHSWQISTR